MDTHALVLIKRDRESEAIKYSMIDSFPSMISAKEFAEYYSGYHEDIIAAIDMSEVSDIAKKAVDLFVIDEYGKIREVVTAPNSYVFTHRNWIEFWEDHASDYAIITTAYGSEIDKSIILKCIIEMSEAAVRKTRIFDKFPECIDLLEQSRKFIIDRTDRAALKSSANRLKAKISSTAFASKHREYAASSCVTAALSLASSDEVYSRSFCKQSASLSRFCIDEDGENPFLTRNMLTTRITLPMILLHNTKG